MEPILIFGPNVAETLKLGLVAELYRRYGHDVPVVPVTWHRFTDGESAPRLDGNVRGRDVYVVQSTNAPTNLMEMKLLLQAASLASAGRLTAVLPYFGYARQDRKAEPRTGISAKLAAQEIEKAMGVSQPRHVVLVHPHFPQLPGFFDIPSDVLFPNEELVEAIHGFDIGGKEVVFVAPDISGTKQADVFAKLMKARIAVIHKRRDPKTGTLGEPMVIGEVAGCACIMVDDMFDTCGTLLHGTVALRQAGAASVHACATHGVFSGPAAERIAEAQVDEIVVTDTLPQVDGGFCGRVQTVGCGRLLATAIWCGNTDNSLSSLRV